MKMDSSIINKEGIEKLLTMLPSEEDISRIEEAQESSPDLPLGTAEQFLLTLRKVQSSAHCLCLFVKINKKSTTIHIRPDFRLSVQ
jgi:hypothetical protein